MASCLAVILKELNLASTNCSTEWNLVLNSGPVGSALKIATISAEWCSSTFFISTDSHLTSVSLCSLYYQNPLSPYPHDEFITNTPWTPNNKKLVLLL